MLLEKRATNVIKFNLFSYVISTKNVVWFILKLWADFLKKNDLKCFCLLVLCFSNKSCVDL